MLQIKGRLHSVLMNIKTLGSKAGVNKTKSFRFCILAF